MFKHFLTKMKSTGKLRGFLTSLLLFSILAGSCGCLARVPAPGERIRRPPAAEAEEQNSEPTLPPNLLQDQPPRPTPTPTPEPFPEWDKDKTLTAEAFALKFIKDQFSHKSPMHELDCYSPNTGESFMDYIRLRRELQMLRNETFGNEKRISDIEVKDKYISENEQMALLVFELLENYIYLDEPDVPAGQLMDYVIVLEKIDGLWKVLWAMSLDGITSMAFRGAGRQIPYYQGQPLIFMPPGSGINDCKKIDVNKLDLNEVRTACQSFTYKNIDEVRQAESDLVKAEKEAVDRNLPILNETPGPGQKSFDREKMNEYIQKWQMARNPEWFDFSNFGGDCMNFVSQIIYAGGGNMAEKWYYNHIDDRMPAWSGVKAAREFFLYNKGQGPNAVEAESWTQMNYGDIILLDITYDEIPDHAMTLSMTGTQARVSGHTTDVYNIRLSDYIGGKLLLHLKYYTE